MARVLTALKPSGLLHLGNYFGAIEPALKLQQEHDLSLFCVDYHAITVPQEPERLREQILFAAAVYLAAGIDPNKTTLFQQSMVSAHTELAWILNCIAHMGELGRMTQYKDKAKDDGSSLSVGLFTYPVLMAADILLYDTDLVPVGSDQKQHVELARDLAERFNRRFGETFVVPTPVIREHGARLMGLDDPSKKMSKSATSPKNYLSLLDEPDVIREKIKVAVTDSSGEIDFDPLNKPGVSNLLTIQALVTDTTVENVLQHYQGQRYGTLKEGVAEAVITWIQPLQERIHAYQSDPEELVRVFRSGAEKASKKAEVKMQLVRERIGVVV